MGSRDWRLHIVRNVVAAGFEKLWQLSSHHAASSALPHAQPVGPCLQLLCYSLRMWLVAVEATKTCPLCCAALCCVVRMQVVFNPKDTNTFASASLDRTVKVGTAGHGRAEVIFFTHTLARRLQRYKSAFASPYTHLLQRAHWS
jgi:hypothetical protein